MTLPLTARDRAVAAAFAVFAGLCFSAGHLAGLAYNGRLYTPLVYDPGAIRAGGPTRHFYKLDHLSWDETAAYARYTREILRGELRGATLDTYQPYVKADLPLAPHWYRDRLGPAVLALLALALPGDVPAAFAAADFLFPAILAFLLVLLCRHFFESLSGCLAAAAAFLWLSIWDLTALLYFLWDAPHMGPIFVRTPYPQLSGILFVLFLLALLRVSRRPSLSSSALLCGALVVNFYTYVYAWTFALAMTGALLLAAAGDHLRLARASIGAVLVSAALAGPVWYPPLISRSPAVDDFIVRLGGESTRRPEIVSLLLCVLLAALTVLAGRRGWRHAGVWTAFWLASLLALHQEVITGRRMQPFHYRMSLVGPLAVLYLANLGSWRWGRILPAGRLRSALALGVVVAGGAQCAWRLAHPMRQDWAIHRLDGSFEQLVEAMRQPNLRRYAFLSNDWFLDQVLPAYVPQKSLQPWFMDTLSNAEIAAVQYAASGLVGEPAPALALFGPQIPLDASRILLVFNRHRPIRAALSGCQVLLSNEDFLVSSCR